MALPCLLGGRGAQQEREGAGAASLVAAVGGTRLVTGPSSTTINPVHKAFLAPTVPNCRTVKGGLFVSFLSRTRPAADLPFRPSLLRAGRSLPPVRPADSRADPTGLR